MKLYTCENGRWLYENGLNFGAWREEDRVGYDEVMDNVFEFELHDAETFTSYGDVAMQDEYPIIIRPEVKITSFIKVK